MPATALIKSALAGLGPTQTSNLSTLALEVSTLLTPLVFGLFLIIN